MREFLKPIKIGEKATIAYKKQSVQQITNIANVEYYEKQLIGFMLYNQQYIGAIKDQLSIDSFSILLHRKIFDACITIDAITDPLCNIVNILTVDALVNTHSEYAERGGYLYLASLQKDCYISVDRIDAYMQIIKRFGAQRKIIDIAANFGNAKLDTADPIAYTVERINAVAATLQSNPAREMLWVKADAALMRPTEYLIDGWLPEKTFSIFYAPPGCGKSFIALDMAMHIASNQAQWCGNVVRGGDVVYLVGEGHHGFRKRHVAWTRHHKVRSDVRMLVSQRAWGLDVEKDFTAICNAINKAECKPKLIIVDTLNRFLVGSESDETSVKTALKMIDRLMREFECAVLLVHHTGWSDEQRIRGHSSWIGAVDVSLQLQRNEDNPDIIELLAKKVKDNEIPKPLSFVLKRYELADMINSSGHAESAAIVEPATAIINHFIENCKARFLQIVAYCKSSKIKHHDVRSFFADVDGLSADEIAQEMNTKGNGLLGTLFKNGLIKLDNYNSLICQAF